MKKQPKKKPPKPATVGPDKQNVKMYPQAGDNPEFVEKLQDLKKVGPGGARENAGRPPGSTAEKIAAEKMGTIANPAIIGLLKLPFELWAQLTKLDSMALTEDEAKLLGLPATQLVNYYLPQTDNPVYLVWASLVGTASYIMLPRLYELKKIRDKKAAQSTGKAGGEKKDRDAQDTTDGVRPPAKPFEETQSVQI